MNSNKKRWLNISVVCVGIALVAVLMIGKFGNFGNRNGASLFSLPATSFSTIPNFVVLAGKSIVSTGNTTITGDIGVSPSGPLGQIHGFSSGTSLNDGIGTLIGTAHENDVTSAQGMIDLGTGYTNIANTTNLPVTQNIANIDLAALSQPITPGVYYTPTNLVFASGSITLDGQGDPESTFIFRTDKTLAIGADTVINLINGASACNIYWQARGATIGAGAIFKGSILSLGPITARDGSNVEGRLLSLSAAATYTVALENVTLAACTPAAPAPTTGTLTVIKHVEGGGPKVAGDFDITVDLTELASQGQSLYFKGEEEGTINTINANAEYVVTEKADIRYTQSMEGDCTGMIVAGQNKTCRIINTYIPPVVPPVEPPVIPPTGGGGGGGGGGTTGGCALPSTMVDGICVPPTTSVLPVIDITKKTNISLLTNGPGRVIYTYQVRNPGVNLLRNVTVTDDSCSPVIYQKGDDGDGSLETNETWNYSCSIVVEETTQSSARVMGYDVNGVSATDVDGVLVTVIAPIGSGTNPGSNPPPSSSGSALGIHIAKNPSPAVLPVGGGAVTYTYTVTNTGSVPLALVTVTDNKCAPVSTPIGDRNSDGLLNTNETWTYTCAMTLTQTTTNVARAEGVANGSTVSHEAFATVVVGTPSLPATGLPPSIKNLFMRIFGAPAVHTETVLGARTGFHVFGNPIRLNIPDIGADAPISKVGVTNMGAMEVPKGAQNAGWFSFGTFPGNAGTAVIAGHSGFENNKPAIFDQLGDLKKGDNVYVEDDQGRTGTFVVRDIKIYPNNANPPEVFSSNDGKAHLNLVTCGGFWSLFTKSHVGRVVVFTDLVEG